jgi:Spy/CpxP family protein refolding chaperone
MKTFLYCAALALASISSLAAQTTPQPSPTPPPAAGQPERMEKFKAALAKLNLTDAQKTQIQQIRATVTDRRERRQQIMAVLTPDQKAQLKQIFLEHRPQGTNANAAGDE